jgi:hypothetical protein
MLIEVHRNLHTLWVCSSSRIGNYKMFDMNGKMTCLTIAKFEMVEI